MIWKKSERVGKHKEKKLFFATGCISVMLLSAIMFTIIISTPASAAKVTCKGKDECAKLQEICRNNNGKMEMWTNTITPGIWGECNTFTVGGPDTPIEASNVIGSTESIGGMNNTGTIPLDTLLNITSTATTNNTATGATPSNQTAIGNVSATEDVVSPQPPVTTTTTNNDNNAPQTETTTAETAIPVPPDEEQELGAPPDEEQELGDQTGGSGAPNSAE